MAVLSSSPTTSVNSSSESTHGDSLRGKLVELKNMCSELPSTRRRQQQRIVLFLVVVVITFSLFIIGNHSDPASMELNPVTSDQKLSSANPKKKSISSLDKLLNKHERQNRLAMAEPNRIWSERCSRSDIMISQGETAPLPNGIPTYTVEIMNVCNSGCVISDIHIKCGWFSSARIVNPRVFKRLRYDDCLVNGGRPLANGRTLSFQYANTFRYPLSVASVKC